MHKDYKFIIIDSYVDIDELKDRLQNYGVSFVTKPTVHKTHVHEFWYCEHYHVLIHLYEPLYASDFEDICLSLGGVDPQRVDDTYTELLKVMCEEVRG